MGDDDGLADNSGACGVEEPHDDEGNGRMAVVDSLDRQAPSDTPERVATWVETTSTVQAADRQRQLSCFHREVVRLVACVNSTDLDGRNGVACILGAGGANW